MITTEGTGLRNNKFAGTTDKKERLVVREEAKFLRFCNQYEGKYLEFLIVSIY